MSILTCYKRTQEDFWTLKIDYSGFFLQRILILVTDPPLLRSKGTFQLMWAGAERPGLCWSVGNFHLGTRAHAMGTPQISRRSYGQPINHGVRNTQIQRAAMSQHITRNKVPNMTWFVALSSGADWVRIQIGHYCIFLCVGWFLWLFLRGTKNLLQCSF